MSVKMKLESISPGKAAEWLTHNISNRPLNSKRAKKYAKAISDDVWALNGETIKFNCNGELIDGQHRLHAVVISGRTIQSYVLRGLPADAFDTIDSGKSRSNGDRLARRGVKHYALVAAITGFVFRHEIGDHGSLAPRPDVMDECLARHSGILEAAHDIASIRPKILTPSISGFLLYYGRHLWGGKSDTFWLSILNAEGLERGTAAHTLYRKLHDAQTRTFDLSRTAKRALCIKAFNAAMLGKSCKVLRWNETEDFPEFVGPKS